MAKKLRAIHPGEFLAELLGERELSQAALARALGVSPMRISHVVKGTRPVTAELAPSPPNSPSFSGAHSISRPNTG